MIKNMSFTLETFKRPFGKGSSIVNIKQIENRFNNLYNQFEDKIEYEVYYISNKDIYLIYFKVPSKEFSDYIEEPLYYDVLLEFFSNKKDISAENNIKNYNFNIFCNSPNFTFVYTYILYKLNSLILSIKDKYSKIALTKEPKIRNPMKVYGFEEKTWISILYMEKHNLFNKDILKSKINDKKTIKDLKKQISSQEHKNLEILNILKTIRDIKEAERKKNKKITHVNNFDLDNEKKILNFNKKYDLKKERYSMKKHDLKKEIYKPKKYIMKKHDLKK